MNELTRRIPMNRLFDDMLALPTAFFDNFFNDFDNSIFKPTRWAKETSSYPMNVVNVTKDGNLVAKRLEYALAGFDKSEIKLSLKNDILTIEAEHAPAEAEDESHEYRGISYKKMTVSYQLMDNADKKAITSKFSNGLLTVTIPLKKTEPEIDESKLIDIE